MQTFLDSVNILCSNQLRGTDTVGLMNKINPMIA